MPEYRDVLQRTGRVTHGNQVTADPGTVIVGKNWEVTRDNTYRKIRGRAAYGSGLPSSNIVQLLQYKSRLLAHMANNTLWYDSTGTGSFVKYTDLSAGDSFPPPASDRLMQGLQANNNFYFSTSTGIHCVETLAGTVRHAGVPKALSFNVYGKGSGATLINGNIVAYRVSWVYEDANGNEIQGAPSDRYDFENASGGTVDPVLIIPIPDDITASHYLRIDRTSETASPALPPEDFQLVYKEHPTAGEITAGEMTVVDELPSGFRGADLYTNTTQQGITKAKERPPKASTITKFKNFTFFGDIENIHRLYTSLVAVTGLTGGTSTLVIADGTNTLTLQSRADQGAFTIGAGAVVDNGSGFVQVTVAGHSLLANDYVRFETAQGADFGPAVEGKTFKITAVAAGTIDINLTWDAAFAGEGTSGEVRHVEDLVTPKFLIYTAGSVAQDVDATARSIVKTINGCTAAANVWYAAYESGADDVPGMIQIYARQVGQNAFYVTANSTTTGGMFSPAIPAAGTTYVSTNDDLQNGLMWSEANEPEAVPLINITRVGSADDPILKVVGLRDSLFIIKQKDGIYRLTGDSTSTFNVDEFDGTVECTQVNSVTKGQNAIYMMTALGYVRVADTGVEEIGRPNEYKDLTPRYNTGYDVDGYGWFSEEDKTYFVSTHDDTDSTDNDIVHTFNAFTTAWMQREHGIYTNDANIRAGIVIDGVMYTAPLSGNGLLVERKTFTTSDFLSPDVSTSIATIDTATNRVTLGVAVTVPEQSLFKQGSLTRSVTDFVNTATLELSSVNNLAADMGTKNVGGTAAGTGGKIRITTTTPHGLSTGNGVTIAAVLGTTEANGDWTIEVIDGTHFELNGSTYTNAYTGGGTVKNTITIECGIVGNLRFHRIHAGVPEYEKEFKDVSFLFDDDETFTRQLTMKTWTDADDTVVETQMVDESNLGWGALPWGTLWGGPSTSDLWRTLVPAAHVRGAHLYIELVHQKPREQVALNGYSVVFDVVDTRYQVTT